MSTVFDEPTVSACSCLRHSLPGAIARAPEVIMLPAEPVSTPPPPWSAMSNGLDEPTRFPSSALPASPRTHEPRRGTRHGSCSSRARPLSVLPTRVARSPRPSSAPGNLSRSMRTRFARANVAHNDTAVPRIPNTPALSWRLRTGRAAAPPTPPCGTAIRSTRRSLPSIQRTPRSPVAVLIYQCPDGERADDSTLQSVALKRCRERFSRPHTRRPP